MIRRALRPGDRQKRQDADGVDEIDPRETMEASENTALPQRRGGGPALHRVDPDRVRKTLSAGGNPAGYARLELMVSTIFDRLVAGERDGLSGG
jgi:hypothetical protein